MTISKPTKEVIYCEISHTVEGDIYKMGFYVCTDPLDGLQQYLRDLQEREDKDELFPSDRESIRIEIRPGLDLCVTPSALELIAKKSKKKTE